MHRGFRGAGEHIARVRALEQAANSSKQLVQSNRLSHPAGSRPGVILLCPEQQPGAGRRELAQTRCAYALALVRLRALAGDPGERSAAEVDRRLAPGFRE